MSIEIVERPAMIVVGLHIKTRPMSPDIPSLWPKFVPRIAEIENLHEPKVSYGVMWHGATMDELHYMASVSSSGTSHVPAGMEMLTLAAAVYASFKYPLSGLSAGFCEIFQKLLPASKYKQAPAPYFERYDAAFDPRNPGSLVEICLPVV